MIPQKKTMARILPAIFFLNELRAGGAKPGVQSGLRVKAADQLAS